MCLAIYRFYWDCKRMGDLEGVFIAKKSKVKKTIGKQLYFGEVLGKHSEISGTLDEEDLTILSDDQDFIQQCIKVFGPGTISGYNPLSYISDEESDDDDDSSDYDVDDVPEVPFNEDYTPDIVNDTEEVELPEIPTDNDTTDNKKYDTYESVDTYSNDDYSNSSSEND